MRASTTKTTMVGRGYASRRMSGRRGGAPKGSWVKTSVAEALPPRGDAGRLESLLALDADDLQGRVYTLEAENTDLSKRADDLGQAQRELQQQGDKLAAMLESLEAQMALRDATTNPSTARGPPYRLLADREGGLWPRQAKERLRKFPGAIYPRGASISVLKEILPRLFASPLEVGIFAISTQFSGSSWEALVKMIRESARVPITRVSLDRALHRMKVHGIDGFHLLLDLGAAGEEIQPLQLVSSLDWGGEGVASRGFASFEKAWVQAAGDCGSMEGRVGDALKDRPEGFNAKVLLEAVPKDSPRSRGHGRTAAGSTGRTPRRSLPLKMT